VKVIVEVDGGSRGNPGPAGFGCPDRLHPRLLRLGPGALEGRRRGLHHDQLSALPGQFPVQIGKGGLVGDQHSHTDIGNVHHHQTRTRLTVLGGGVGEAVQPAQQRPGRDVLTEGHQPLFGIAVGRSHPGADQHRCLGDPATRPPRIGVDQQIGPDRLGRRLQSAPHPGILIKVERHAALAPHHQVQTG
jgi:hypothetical protein